MRGHLRCSGWDLVAALDEGVSALPYPLGGFEVPLRDAARFGDDSLDPLGDCARGAGFEAPVNGVEEIRRCWPGVPQSASGFIHVFFKSVQCVVLGLKGSLSHSVSSRDSDGSGPLRIMILMASAVSLWSFSVRILNLWGRTLWSMSLTSDPSRQRVWMFFIVPSTLTFMAYPDGPLGLRG